MGLQGRKLIKFGARWKQSIKHYSDPGRGWIRLQGEELTSGSESEYTQLENAEKAYGWIG